MQAWGCSSGFPASPAAAGTARAALVTGLQTTVLVPAQGGSCCPQLVRQGSSRHWPLAPVGPPSPDRLWPGGLCAGARLCSQRGSRLLEAVQSCSLSFHNFPGGLHPSLAGKAGGGGCRTVPRLRDYPSAPQLCHYQYAGLVPLGSPVALGADMAMSHLQSQP